MLSQYIKTANRRVKKQNITEIYRLLFGNSYVAAQNDDFKFVFSAGEKATISEVAKFVSEGYKAIECEKASIISTIIGPLFCDSDSCDIVAGNKIIPKISKPRAPRAPRAHTKKIVQKKNHRENAANLDVEISFDLLEQTLHRSLILKAKFYWIEFIKENPLEMEYMRHFNVIDTESITQV